MIQQANQLIIALRLSPQSLMAIHDAKYIYNLTVNVVWNSVKFRLVTTQGDGRYERTGLIKGGRQTVKNGVRKF